MKWDELLVINQHQGVAERGGGGDEAAPPQIQIFETLVSEFPPALSIHSYSFI